MKRIGILSDTHSCWDERYARHFADCDEIWHAGDIGDISILSTARRARSDSAGCRRPLRITGQYVCKCNEIEIFEVEGVKVLLTHIGGYPGKYFPGIKQMLRDNDIKLFVDGHSHILKVMFDSQLNILHINPGAAGTQGWQQQRTLVKLTIDNAAMKDLEVIELSKPAIK